MTTILVAGGRVGVPFALAARALHETILTLPPPYTIVEGGAEGWDKLAKVLAQHEGWGHVQYAVDSRLDGDDDQAPKRRNRRMLDTAQPDYVIVGPGGPGSRHMFSIAHQDGFAVCDLRLELDGTWEAVWLQKQST